LNSIEDKESEIIAKEAKKDDEAELGYIDEHGGTDFNPFDNDDVQAVLVEKDDRINELDFQVHELAKVVNTGQVNTDHVINHPTYKALLRGYEDMQVERDNLLLEKEELIRENEELKETARKLTKQSFKPAAELKGSVGQ